jgi:predicted acylesterase/phospholipase RssA
MITMQSTQELGRSSIRRGLFGIIVLFSITLQGCGVLPRRDAVPPMLTKQAVTSVCPGTRYWPNLDLAPLFQNAIDSNDRERAALSREGEAMRDLPPAYYLAISGGGDEGAFGAGLLVGWTIRGNRPEFKVVTGISAGALIAPFAFLGPQYDKVLRSVSMSIGPRDIFHVRNILAAISSDAFADDTPLASMIEKYVTREVLAAIAREYAKGRVLLIGTTNLDSRQPVVWNMGAIAASEDPRALELFRKIVLASASIPGVFPPVMIDVEVDGRQYQEMHVDGGVITQVFLFPPAFVERLRGNRSVKERARNVYVILNSRIDPQWQAVARRSTHVARRALEALIEAQGINDLYRLQVIAQQEEEHFNIAYIGEEFNYPHGHMFATDYLRHLFGYSYQLAMNGDPWRKALP